MVDRLDLQDCSVFGQKDLSRDFTLIERLALDKDTSRETPLQHDSVVSESKQFGRVRDYFLVDERPQSRDRSSPRVQRNCRPSTPKTGRSQLSREDQKD